jgi:23S rRNA (guanine745-N1)-methyltransferase
VAPRLPRPGHGLLRCPVCRLDLAGAGGILVCGNRHSFDLARDGYVNLLDGRRRSLIARGDSAEQLGHRTAFLEAGHFDPVASAIAAHVAHAGPASRAEGWRVLDAGHFDPVASAIASHVARAAPVEGWRVLDAGCGTGHHLAGVSAALKTPVIGLGFDIARTAAQRAARQWRELAFAVADVWVEWPVHDETADLVLSIFAPKNFAEMSRVLRPGGWLALAYPGPNHLAELVHRFGLMQQHAGKTGRYAEATERLVGPSTTVRLVHRMSLDRESVRHAVLMGPNARHIAALDVEAAAIDVTIDIAMLFARKPG